MNDQLDPQAMALTKAIRQVESGGNFKARSKDGSFGAYQFLKPTWDNTARKYGVNAEWEKATPQQQNEVAYKQIKEWKDKGHNVGEIASMWNAGAGRPQAYLQGLKGTNSSGVNYNVANYAKKVATLYQGYKGQSQPQAQQEPIEPVEPIEPTIPEQKQVIQTQGQPVSVRKDRTQPTLVGGILREVIKAPLKAALSVARPFVDPFGKKGGLSVNTKYLGNVGDYGTEIEKSTTNLANKYKAGDISLGRAVIGGIGAGAEQAMDLASVVPVGGVANQAVKGTLREAVIPTFKTAAKESLIRGGAISTGYDVSSQLASGEKYKPLQTLAAGTIGTVADFGLSYGLPKTVAGTKSFAKNNLTKTGRDAKLTRKVEEELRNVENNYAKLRKNQKFSKDANTETRKRIIASGVLDDATDTTGTINTDNAIKKYRDASGLTGNEGVVRENLERLGEKVNLKSVEKELTDSIYASGLEGAELRTALNNVKKEISGYRLRADANGDVPLTFIHDTKIGTTSGINFMTPPEVKAYKKALASGLRSTVENNSQFNVKEVNQELSPLFKDIEYLESLNGRKVKGGKLGKYASQITGNIVGGAVGGAIGGFPGSAIGTVVGGEAGSSLMGSSLSKVLRGPGAKELPVSKVLQKAAATAKSPRLGLPEPKAGLPKSQNFVPIELPGVKEPVYRSPRIAGNTTQYTNIPNTKPKNIDIPTELPKSKVKSSDLSTGVKKAFNDAKDTLKTLKDKNVRERGSISLESILPESKSVGNQGLSLTKNTTEDLIQQAKKYKSAEEFVKAKTEGKFGNIKKIDITLQQEKAFISDFSDKFLTQKSQASGLTYSTLDKMGSLNTALKQKGFKGVSNSADFKGIYSLDKVIDNSALFEKYPDLKKVNVIFADFHTPTQKGVHIGNDIFLNSKLYAKDTTNIESTLVHEIEHAIQDIEGKIPKYSQFEQGRGMTPDEYVKDARENGARAKQQDYINHIQTKSQLIDIWNKANKKILPKNTKLIKNKDGSITYGSQKMSGDFKGMPDIEIIKMFDNTPF